jgi:hypothetical protein
VRFRLIRSSRPSKATQASVATNCIATCMADNAHPWADVGDGRTSLWGGGKRKNPSECDFTAQPGESKKALDEPNGFITGTEPYGYHPEMGGYPDRYNHLLAGTCQASSTIPAEPGSVSWGN